MYKVIELQKNGDSCVHLVFDAETRDEAYSKYYQVLSAAAISTVEYHSALMMTDTGDPVAHKSFEHKVTAQEG